MTPRRRRYTEYLERRHIPYRMERCRRTLGRGMYMSPHLSMLFLMVDVAI